MNTWPWLVSILVACTQLHITSGADDSVQHLEHCKTQPCKLENVVGELQAYQPAACDHTKVVAGQLFMHADAPVPAAVHTGKCHNHWFEPFQHSLPRQCKSLNKVTF